ncbi:MAG: hypothetical protein HPY81_08595 [Firmicutes bacterium]|nr:hypothetical protein [Bacillota bacterium]
MLKDIQKKRNVVDGTTSKMNLNNPSTDSDRTPTSRPEIVMPETLTGPEIGNSSIEKN